jgi:hypothetical protein
MRLVSAEAINEKGAISGWGSDQYGDDRAFVLIPVR